MRCHDVQTQLQQYVDGTLEPSLSKRVEAHLARCDKCRTTLAHLQAVEEALETWPLITEPADLAPRVMAQVRSYPRTPRFRLRWTDLILSLTFAALTASGGLVLTALWLWRLRAPTDLSNSLQQAIDVMRLQMLPLEMLGLEMSLALQSLFESSALLWTPVLAGAVALIILVAFMRSPMARQRRILA